MDETTQRVFQIPLRTAQTQGAWSLFWKTAQARALFALRRYLDRARACLRCVCTQTLTGLRPSVGQRVAWGQWCEPVNTQVGGHAPQGQTCPGAGGQVISRAGHQSSVGCEPEQVQQSPDSPWCHWETTVSGYPFMLVPKWCHTAGPRESPVSDLWTVHTSLKGSRTCFVFREIYNSLSVCLSLSLSLSPPPPSLCLSVCLSLSLSPHTTNLFFTVNLAYFIVIMLTQMFPWMRCVRVCARASVWHRLTWFYSHTHTHTHAHANAFFQRQ